jgi:predicted transcriptional regulator of viral defense system
MNSKRLNNLTKATFTTLEAKNKGISPRMLFYYVSKGLISRISHGVYAKAGFEAPIDLQSQMKLIQMLVPQCVVGRISALKLHGLLDVEPQFIELIVPHDNVPKRSIEDAQFFRAPRASMKFGIEKKQGILVTTLERTLIECLRTGISIHTVRLAYEEAQKKRLKPSLSQMDRFAKLLRVQGRFKIFRESIL